MVLKIAICDDDKTDLHNLYTTLNSYQMMMNVDFQLSGFPTGKALLDSYPQPGAFHVIFLDVEMPELNGIETAKLIRQMRDRHVYIVFVSNYPQYMQESFSVHPYYYIQKPISMEKTTEIMNHILQDIEADKALYTLLQEDLSEETINLKDVFFIETVDAKRELLCFHFENRTITTKGILNSWEKELASHNFYSCYRGYLVNLIHIHFFDKGELILRNGIRIPVSKRNEKQLRELYLNRVVILQNY